MYNVVNKVIRLSRKRDDTVQFTRDLINNSNTPQFSVASELMDYLGAVIGDPVAFQKDKGKYGRYGIIRLYDPNEESPLLSRKISHNNGTPRISIPNALMEFLVLSMDGTIEIQPDHYEDQKALTFWNLNHAGDGHE